MSDTDLLPVPDTRFTSGPAAISMPPVLTPDTLTLKPYQQEVLNFAARPFCAIWLGIGYGKTLTTLKTLHTYQPSGHILVIGPKTIVRSTWINEIEKWNFPLRVKSLIVDENDRELSTEDRLQAFRDVFTDPPTMYFINQELLTRPSKPIHALRPNDQSTRHGPYKLVQSALLHHAGADLHNRDDLIRVVREDYSAAYPQNKPLSKAAVARETKALLAAGDLVSERCACPDCDGEGCAACCVGLIDQMPRVGSRKNPQVLWPFATIVIDEAQGFSSHSSARFKALQLVRPATKRIIELTGTPATNGLHDLWSQIYLLDQGAALGRNITAFRNRWFIEESLGPAGAKRYKLRAGAETEIYEAISHLVVSAHTTKLDLPPLNPIQDIPVVLPQDLLEQYKAFKKNLVLPLVKQYSTASGTTQQVVSRIIAENRGTLNGKLLQFASGAIYAGDPDDPSTKDQVEIVHNEKLHMLEYLVRDQLKNGPMIIAHYFRPDRERILKHLTAAGIRGVKIFDGSRTMLADWNAGKIPVLLLHPASAGHGLNFQDGGKTLIWFTVTHSLGQWMQTVGRLYRTGQTQQVTVFRLLTQGTIDVEIPGILDGKEAVQDQLLTAVSTTDNSGGSTTSTADPTMTEDEAKDAAIFAAIGEDLEAALGIIRATGVDPDDESVDLSEVL